MSNTKKIPLSIKISPALYGFIKNKPNKSRYIEELIKQDIQLKESPKIYTAITQQILEDVEFLESLRLKLSKVKGESRTDLGGETIIETNDWGA